MRITLTVPAVPVAQPRQRNRVAHIGGRAIAQNYTPTRHPVNAFKAAVQSAASEAIPAPLDGPLILTAEFVMPRPKAQMWKTKPMPRIAHAKKPDLDNLLKSLQDGLSGIAWRDDSQVHFVRACKWTASGSESPRVEVVLESAQK